MLILDKKAGEVLQLHMKRDGEVRKRTKTA
jgi:hypothetical protein